MTKAIFTFLPGQKRGVKMASIYKRGKVWYLTAYVNGRRARKRIGKSKKLAEPAREDIEVRIAKGELDWEEVRDSNFREFTDGYCITWTSIVDLLPM